MSNNQPNELPVALERVAKAESALTNAKRRLSRSEEQVRTAKSDVAAAETEVKDSTAALETLIRKVLPQAMRKGGSAAVLALGEVISKLSDDGGSQQLPLGDAGQASGK